MNEVHAHSTVEESFIPGSVMNKDQALIDIFDQWITITQTPFALLNDEQVKINDLSTSVAQSSSPGLNDNLIRIKALDEINSNLGVRNRPKNSQPQLWKKNVRKRCRVEGLPYTASNRSEKAGKAMKSNLCLNNKCQNKCGLVWTETERAETFKLFWLLGL